MIVGRIVGNATSTVKHPTMQGWKLLVVQPVHDATGEADGHPVLAVDALGAGIGETVILSSDGKATGELLDATNTPVRWSVLGIRNA